MIQQRFYENIPKTGFLRLPQILSIIPISKGTWWNWVAKGKAPAGIKLSSNITAWKAEAIHKFLNELSGGEQ